MLELMWGLQEPASECAPSHSTWLLSLGCSEQQFPSLPALFQLRGLQERGAKGVLPPPQPSLWVDAPCAHPAALQAFCSSGSLVPPKYLWDPS